VRFQDAARDGRAVVYAGIQADPIVARAADALAAATHPERVMARAVTNGESTDPTTWLAIFPTLFGPHVAGPDREHAETVLAVALEVAERGEQVRSQFRGAIVEALAARLLAGGPDEPTIRRERRILFDGVRSEIHPYDVTVERDGSPEAWDCKWGARGIGDDVLHQLDDARSNATDEGITLRTGLVVFDAERSCRVRLAGLNAPQAGTELVALEGLDRLGGATK
jgi:hypothetical protein